MATDWYTRLVLTVVAICLAFLTLQSLSVVGTASGSGEEEGRYRLTVVPMARMAIRFDSQTGTSWTALFPDLKIWTKIAETPSELLDAAVAGLPPAPAPEAPAAAPPAPPAPAAEAVEKPEAPPNP